MIVNQRESKWHTIKKNELNTKKTVMYEKREIKL
jgi:hypothetical protein